MSLLNSKKILICMGTGGVGKTTVAAALSVLAVKRGKKVLVLTIDPSRRLASALGLDNWSGEEVQVKVEGATGTLFAAMINPKNVFDNFVKTSAANPTDIDLILKNSFYKELSTSLSGTQEFTSLQALYKYVKSDKYDLIILDTPPAQHTMDFLESPQHIYNLFSGSVVQWFSQINTKKSFMFNLINRGTVMAFGIFEKITGSQFLKEMELFFGLISKFREHVKDVSSEVLKILQSNQTGFILVTRFDYIKMKEASRVKDKLRSKGFDLSKIIMNGVLPEVDIEGLNAPAHIKSFFESINNYVQFQKNNFNETQRKWTKQVPVQYIPMIEYNPDEYYILNKLSEELSNEF